MQKKNKLTDVYIFIVLLFVISLALRFFFQQGVNIPIFTIPIMAGLLAFIFWTLVRKEPIVEIYSRVYPYKKLKLWGALVAFIFFEYVLARGMRTMQLKLVYEHFYSIIAIFAGAIAFYFSFVRMKVSLRYLFWGISIPVLALGSAIGLGKYFGFITFLIPTSNITNVVLQNTAYWIIFSMLYQLVCEEPAFRGFLAQRLMNKSTTAAVLISSVIFAIWHIIIMPVRELYISHFFLTMAEYFIIGCLLATLFIKGRNLLIAAISHGIIVGLKISIFAGGIHPGLSRYFQFIDPSAELKFTMLWSGCLLIGVMLVLITPEKQRSHTQCQKYLR